MDLLTSSALIASGAVVLVQEILKLNIVPGTFASRWPVQTNVVLSVVATLFVVHVDWNVADVASLPRLLAQVGTVAVVAAIVYNQLVRPAVKTEAR